MKINFEINKNYLIKHTLFCAERNIFSSDKNKKDIFTFSKHVLDNYPDYYDFMVGVISPKNMDEKNINSFIKRMSKELPVVLNKIKQSKEFKKLYTQTEKYLISSKKEWERNLNETERIISKLTKFNLNKEFTVYITHPSQRNGSYWCNNQISWGTSEKWDNYTTIYLWHEILHSYFDDSDKNHAIIELIIDEELRRRLNGVDYPPFEGHKNLSQLKEKMLPHWKKYIDSKDGDIKEFQKKIKNLKQTGSNLVQ